MAKRIIYLAVLLTLLNWSCKKDNDRNEWTISTYSGSYNNVQYIENLVGEFSAGTYKDSDIPDDLKYLDYGRIEIDFSYNGGALNYFAPLMYYGSVNKDINDDSKEEPKFHMAVEIGHYNVIPFAVEYLFYTICTFNQPQYCRDTYMPVFTGQSYKVIIDKKPEGMIFQMRRGDNILNIFPHSFFPDSAQMFFRDVTAYTDRNKGDSLEMVLMVGRGFAGIEKGVHELNGQVSSLRIYKYTISGEDSGYELKHVRNQHSAGQQVNYIPVDHLSGEDKYIRMNYRFFPYKFQSGELVPDGTMKDCVSDKLPNNRPATGFLTPDKTGYYKVILETLDWNDNILRSAVQPFEIWVYPKEWEFDF